MIRLSCYALAAVCSFVQVTSASGQADAFLSSAGLVRDPRFLHLDSAQGGIAAIGYWRGMYVGDLPVSLGLNIALWRIDGVMDRHALIADALFSLPTLHRNRLGRMDVGVLRGAYRYRLDTEDGEFQIGTAVHRFADRNDTDISPELDLAIQRRFDIRVSELRPLLRLYVSRDLERFDAFYVEPAVMVDLGVSRRNNMFSIGGHIDISSSWSDYPKPQSRPSEFGYHATSAAVWGYRDWSSSIIGPARAEVGVEKLWPVGDSPASGFNLRVRIVKR